MKIRLFAVVLLLTVHAAALEKSVMGLPREIKVAVSELSVKNKQTLTFNAEIEVKKLFGPRALIPGEMVKFRYGWPLTAVKRDDPSKVVNSQYLKENPFLFEGGDAFKRAELKIMTTGDIVVLSRPTRADAPVGALIELEEPSIIRMPKQIVQNRLCAPSNMGRTQDGKEFWHYEHSVTEMARTVRTATSTTSGAVGFEPFSATTTQSMAVMLNRTFTIWNFTLIFDDEGRVVQIVAGKTGAGEWKEVGSQ